MRLAALGFLTGVLVLQQLSSLPDPVWRYSLPIALLLFFSLPKWRFLFALFLGFLYAMGPAQDYLQHRLPVELEGQDLILTGIIRSIPVTGTDRARFELDVETLSLQTDSQDMPRPAHLPRHITLSWFHAADKLTPGERWRLPVRLKRPRGFMNPGGFDYEAWLYQRGIHATGYVRVSRDKNSQFLPEKLTDDVSGYAMTALRQKIAEALAGVLGERKELGIVQALAIGQRDLIDNTQWEVLRRTGTNHLIAISGLHIGLIAGLMFFSARWLWCRSARLVRLLNAPQAAAIASLLSALIYAALAGFSVPTQRALIMVAVVMLAILRRRAMHPSHGIALAALGVLLVDPTAVLDVGFWLSFCAVAVILFAMSGRIAVKGWWWRWGRVQWVALIGLVPLLVVFFNQVPLLSPVANFLAIPWVSFVTVPLCLAAVPGLLLWPPLGQLLAEWAASSVDVLWRWLELLSQIEISLWPIADPGALPLGLAMAACVLLLLPKGMAVKWLAILLLVPLAYAGPRPLNDGQVELSILDVGQGSAIVVRTTQHVLLYDAGPWFSERFDTGSAVVLPYLRSQGLHRIDKMVVSHGDNDHSGGTSSVLAGIAVGELISSESRGLRGIDFELCQNGQTWRWDGVDFLFLNPGDATYAASHKANNRSCVLRIQASGASALLTGDIEKAAEANIQRQMGSDTMALHTDVLLVPHHGSATSSSREFIDSVSPRIAALSRGFNNRYGFPKKEVLERYLQRGITIVDTADHGTIRMVLGGESGVAQLPSYRLKKQRYWSASLE